MNALRSTRTLLAGATLVVTPAAWPQQPFDLDGSFQTAINSRGISSIAPLPDGRIFISGMINFPGDLPSDLRGSAMLLANGQRDQSFPNFPYSTGGGKITPWNDRFYVSDGLVRRLTPDCLIDTTFHALYEDPLFSFLQGGDYHVYPDGRVVIGGVNNLQDTARGYVGLYCLIWFTNTGHLDTTAHHRTCAGSLDYFAPLPNGQFIGSGSTGIWDGHQASNIIRFNADGSLDSTFQAHVWWGQAYSFLPLPDGRVYVGGNFRVEGLQDTLNFVRFMPDGSLDPTFNNTAKYRFHDLLYPGVLPWGIIRSITPLNNGQLIVSGNFDSINDQVRGGIALIDTSGNLLDDLFSGAGGGGCYYQPTADPPILYSLVIGGIKPAPDGNYYIYGAYNGYDDGTTNDTLQRFVSRLHGLNVGVEEVEVPVERPLTIYPNPASSYATLAYDFKATPDKAYLSIRDAVGKEIQRLPVQAAEGQTVWDTRSISPGAYTVELVNGGRTLGTAKLIVKR